MTIMTYIVFPEWLKPEVFAGLPVRWYGIMYVLAFTTTFLLFAYQVKRGALKISMDDMTSLFLWTILGLLIGARVFAALVYDTSGYYLTHPWMIFWPFREGTFTGLQGMSYHGGVIGAVIGGYLFCRRYGFEFLRVADTAAAAIPLGYTFGRLGNFINGEQWGRVTDRPWGMIFPHAPRLSTRLTWVQDMADRVGIPFETGSLVNLPRHASQLYEALFEGVILWLFLWFIVRNRSRITGTLIGWYLIGYGLIRFVIEYFREPDADIGFIITADPAPAALFQSVLNISLGQILCLVMILSGAVLLIVRARQSSRAV